jgi:hypothetical protein
MPKSTSQYWNTLDGENNWQAVKDLEGLADELTLSFDEKTDEYTRLTRFRAGADTTAFGGKSHEYPEEVFIVSGRLYDQAFDMWLETGPRPLGFDYN